MDAVQLFSNLVNLAAVDGKFAEAEIKFLVSRAHSLGLPDDEFETALVGISEGQIEISIPEDHSDRVHLLKEMIRLMAADGEMAEMEKEFCARASAKMDFNVDEFQRLLEEVIDEWR